MLTLVFLGFGAITSYFNDAKIKQAYSIIEPHIFKYNIDIF